MAKKKQIYETIKVREWRVKKPNWGMYSWWLILNMFIQFVVFNYQSLISRIYVFIAIATTFYLINGAVPYYKVRYVTTEKDAILGDGEQ